MVITRKVPRSLDFLMVSSITFDPQLQFFSHKVPCIHIHLFDDMLMPETMLDDDSKHYNYPEPTANQSSTTLSTVLCHTVAQLSSTTITKSGKVITSLPTLSDS
jgi:hypothetical protein